MNRFEALDILGLAPDAAAEEIKHAFRRLAMLYHPDIDASGSGDSSKFIKLREAYDCLLDSGDITVASFAGWFTSSFIDAAEIGFRDTFNLGRGRFGAVCKECYGKGTVRINKGPFIVIDICRNCRGEGRINIELSGSEVSYETRT